VFFFYLSAYGEQTAVELPELLREGYADEDEKQIDKVPRKRGEDIYDIDDDRLPQAVGHARENLSDIKDRWLIDHAD